MVDISKNREPEKDRLPIPDDSAKIFQSVSKTLKFALVVTEEAINDLEDQIEDLGGLYNITSINITFSGVSIEDPTDQVTKDKIEKLNEQRQELLQALPHWTRFIDLQEKGFFNSFNIENLSLYEWVVEKMFISARRSIISGQRNLLDRFEEQKLGIDINTFKKSSLKLVENLLEVTYKLEQIEIGLKNLSEHFDQIKRVSRKEP